MSPSEFASLLVSCSKDDSVAEFYLLCMQVCYVVQTIPDRAGQLASGINSFLEQLHSAAITEHALALLVEMLKADTSGVSVFLLRSLAPLMDLFRAHLCDPTVTQVMVTSIGMTVEDGAHEHAFQAVFDAGFLPLLAEAARRHLAVEVLGVAASCFHTATGLCQCCRRLSIRAAAVDSGLPDLAIQAILLRGSSLKALHHAGGASTLICNTLMVDGQRAKVLASGVTAIDVAALPCLLRDPFACANPSIWAAFASMVVFLPYKLYDDYLGPIDSAMAAIVDALQISISTAHNEGDYPVVKWLLTLLANVMCQKPEAAAALKSQGALAIVRKAAVQFPALRALAAEVEVEALQAHPTT